MVSFRQANSYAFFYCMHVLEPKRNHLTAAGLGTDAGATLARWGGCGAHTKMGWRPRCPSGRALNPAVSGGPTVHLDPERALEKRTEGKQRVAGKQVPLQVVRRRGGTTPGPSRVCGIRCSDLQSSQKGTTLFTGPSTVLLSMLSTGSVPSRVCSSVPVGGAWGLTAP